jgi:hypothetical protein
MDARVRRLAGLLGMTMLAVLAAAPGASAIGTTKAVVALGDSAISGEAAGSYEPGTDQTGNYCHRSLNALIEKTTIPGIQERLNLACSGAKSANLWIGGPGQNGEPAQSEKLRTAARDYDVELVIVEVGTNDDPSFSSTATTCVTAFVLFRPRCSSTYATLWPPRVDAMVPKVQRALSDTRTIMRAAGYADGDWTAVLASYWLPVPAYPRYSTYWGKLYGGCPLYHADMEWAAKQAVPYLSSRLRDAAVSQGFGFLDLSVSMKGREVCAQGITSSQEWTTGVKYTPNISNWYTFDAVRQSLHVNARGHAQLGACLTEYAVKRLTSARCVRGTDGALHAIT